MGVFNLKLGDLRPVLDVTLHDPAPAGSPPGTLGEVHDLTGSTSWKLNIYLSDGTVLQRTMLNQGSGVLRYIWVASDWDAASSGSGTRTDPYLVGGLVAGPELPLGKNEREHTMEYEVEDASGAPLTFPNGSEDILRIRVDIAHT